MTRHQPCHLLDMLAEVPDPRNKKGKRHPLKAILALTVIRLLCQQRSYTRIAKWARLHPELRNALGFTAKQTPAAATFHYLYRRLGRRLLRMPSCPPTGRWDRLPTPSQGGFLFKARQLYRFVPH